MAENSKRDAARRRLQEIYRSQALAMRAEADAVARLKGGVDDPLVASTHSTLDQRQALYVNWHEFAQVVCEPIVRLGADTFNPELQQAMARFRAASPLYVATALVLADGTLDGQSWQPADDTGNRWTLRWHGRTFGIERREGPLTYGREEFVCSIDGRRLGDSFLTFVGATGFFDDWMAEIRGC